MAEQPQLDVPKEMRNYFVGLLTKGENFREGNTPESQQLQQQHLAYNRKLSEQQKYLIFGPLLDNGRIRGINVIDAASIEEAEAIMRADPAVQAGRFAFEVHPAFLPALDAVVVEY